MAADGGDVLNGTISSAPADYLTVSESLQTGGNLVLIGSTVDFTDASSLDCPMSSPVARVKRIFCDAQGRIVYYALLTYRGDKFEVEHNLHDYVEDAGPRKPKARR